MIQYSCGLLGYKNVAFFLEFTETRLEWVLHMTSDMTETMVP